MAVVPMVLGVDTLAWAPITLAASRAGCWDHTLEWAGEARDRAAMFDDLFARCPRGAPSAITRSLGLWASYKPEAPRSARIAWLKRHGCRVVAGQFIIETGANHEEVLQS
jgi:hypothetical protein